MYCHPDFIGGTSSAVDELAWTSPMLPWELEDWLTEEGGNVVDKSAALGEALLAPDERLLYEVWLFDTETRNGGVSQYFCNRGNEQWASLCKAARAMLPSFAGFAAIVDGVVGGKQDPYASVMGTGEALDRAYEGVQAPLVTELRARLSRG